MTLPVLLNAGDAGM